MFLIKTINQIKTLNRLSKYLGNDLSYSIKKIMREFFLDFNALYYLIISLSIDRLYSKLVVDCFIISSSRIFKPILTY